MMIYWPAPLAAYRFNPQEVEQITGVTHHQQRQWRVRYLDFRQALFVHGDHLGKGRWSWEGVQLVTLFAQSLLDLKDGALARRVLMLDEEPGVTRDELGIFHSDQRNLNGDPDLLIVGDLANLNHFGFSTSGAQYLGSNISVRPSAARLYAVNFSALQRQLFERVRATVDLENGPGANPTLARMLEAR